MHKYLLAGAAMISAAALFGAAEGARAGEGLTVAFEWLAQDRCGTASPALTVTGVPGGTASLAITLVDLDVPGFAHGGGKTTFRGEAAIPAGAVSFNLGPCPPSGSHDYRITVKALSSYGDELAQGAAERPCCAQFTERQTGS